MHLNFLAKSSKSLSKSALLINDGLGEEPKRSSRTIISVLDITFLLKLNMQTEEKGPSMWSLSGSKILSLLTPNDWRISNNESSPCVRSCEESLTLREAETRAGTYEGHS